MILSIGSINADFVLVTGASPSGPGTVPARELLRLSGGKAANVAVLARRLGTPARLVACVGDDDLATQALAGPSAAGVDVTGVRRRPGPSGYASVVVPPDGAKAIVLALNANDAWADAAAEVAADVEGAPPGSLVVVDLEIPAAVAEAALRAARSRGLTTVVDPAPPDRASDTVVALADHLTPDATEASALTGVDTSDEDGCRRAAERLRDRGAGTVHVKLPDGGCATATARGGFVVAPPSGLRVVDATGAGDAFAGGLAWALERGEPVERAACLGVAASACAVEGLGSQESFPDRARLEAMAARVPRPRP